MLLAIAVAAALTTVNVPDTLSKEVAQANRESGIAVLLPETIDTEFKKVYTNSLPTSDGRYALVIGASRSCLGQSVCGIVNFYGIQGAKPRGGKKVKLAKGHKGRYLKGKCGANCTFPAVRWKQGGVLYEIAYKESGGKADMVNLADSAILAGAR